eukprot:TRINITY_DN54951_c0_g1_i1.p1 TRINITY_DN54951_c0_g1~~TRINITY_DN54951_c0_g1_i1.p1  ORF type:complete len:319 (+),score=98.32 TRINITY_DN54951_c0_g1_i1:54-1010(+)
MRIALILFFFFFQAEDGIRDAQESRGLGDVYKRQPTSVGFMLSHCVHQVPERSSSLRMPDGSHHVTPPDGLEPFTLPPCNTSLFGAELPMLLPADYDGWLAYTALNTSRVGLVSGSGFDRFTNTMSVPDLPESRPDILYLFPGLQNQDWIPKHDPESQGAGFDIIQPVLQYPGGFLSQGWSLKSWYVTLDAGALHTTGINGIQPGDAVLCNMSKAGEDSWSISGSLKSDPKKVTTQTAQKSRLSVQPWAYNTVECYGCNGCSTYPKNPVVFTENALWQDGVVVESGDKWVVDPKPAAKLECKEAVTVHPNGDTVMSFQ